VNAKLGRQELAYADERLIEATPWTNFGRTFDAAKLHYEPSKFWIDVFSSTVVYIFRDSFAYSDLFNGAGTHRDQVFSAMLISAAPRRTINFQAHHVPHHRELAKLRCCERKNR
jgi:hypothetical protein